MSFQKLEQQLSKSVSTKVLYVVSADWASKH